MKIAVSGTGYVGIAAAAILAELGHSVICVDVDEKKIAAYNAGECPIFEPGLPELLQQYKHNLTFTTDYRGAYRDAEVIFIAVGTPERPDGSANLKYVMTVAEQIAENVERDCVVVVKSTVPLGTNDAVAEHISSRLKNKVRVEVVSNPEFLAQGTAIRDMREASRIVVGAESEYGFSVMKTVYAKASSPILCVGRRSAEMIKYASNDFLALKLSYINEIANLCEKFGADIEDVAKGMGLDPRIGAQFLRAGVGYGGSCFPKDTKALHWLAVVNGEELKTIKAAIDVNTVQKLRLVKKAKQYYDSFEDLTVAVLGLTFKPGTDDLRDAPSLDNIPVILDEGGKIKVWDPVGQENFRKKFPNLTYCGTIGEALKDADICLIFTEWPEVKDLKPEAFLTMKTPIILDGRNCFSLDSMKRKRLIYNSIGRKTVGVLKFKG